MKELHNYLSVGKLNYSRNEISLVVRSIDEITKVILPHFDKHPLRGHKLEVYLIFKKVVLLIKEGKHRNLIGFLQILDLAYFINATTQRTEESKQKILEKLFAKFGSLPEFEPICKESLNKLITLPLSGNLDSNYLVGLVDGDGSFNFGFKSNRRRVVPNFTIVQGNEDRAVLEDVKSYLGCGKVYDLKTNTSRYQVENVSDLITKVLPVFKDNVFNTSKQSYFSNTVEAWNILATKGISKDEDLLKVVELVYDINLEGKRRKLVKEEYLKLFIC